MQSLPVLCWPGRSRRFGRDKTGLLFPGRAEDVRGERTLLLHAAGVLERLLGDPARVYISSPFTSTWKKPSPSMATSSVLPVF